MLNGQLNPLFEHPAFIGVVRRGVVPLAPLLVFELLRWWQHMVGWYTDMLLLQQQIKYHVAFADIEVIPFTSHFILDPHAPKSLGFWVHSSRPTSCSSESDSDKYSSICTGCYLPFVLWNRFSKDEVFCVS
jgi:hypothetical protein